MRRSLTCVALLSACGVPFHAAGTCSVQGVGSFQLEDTRPCGCLERLVQDAMATAELTTGVRQDLSALTVQLYGTDELNPVGQYHPESDTIESERFGRSLAHELFHRTEIKQGVSVWASARHEGWQARGWTQAGDDFWRRWSPDTSTQSCW